jgi:hypothetical protein
VAFRSSLPDNETVNEAKEKLQDENTNVSQLVQLPPDHCLLPETTTEGGSTNE